MPSSVLKSGFKPEAESGGGTGADADHRRDVSVDQIQDRARRGDFSIDLFDPAVNIRFGAYLLATCLARYDGDFSTAAAAYHSGMGLVDSLLQKAEYSADGKLLRHSPMSR